MVIKMTDNQNAECAVFKKVKTRFGYKKKLRIRIVWIPELNIRLQMIEFVRYLPQITKKYLVSRNGRTTVHIYKSIKRVNHHDSDNASGKTKKKFDIRKRRDDKQAIIHG